MEEFVFKNNAGEEFKFFINEKGNLSLNIRENEELIACFIIEYYEFDKMKNYLNNIL